ncbi:MAG: TetR/AcrR family transcriptional regulator [Clostridia bacterium]|nr:TetR/AcrR family transcriptional regulator [Clostridia bacterium]
MTTKEKILEEALTLFSKNGYDGTSVDQIAERVGIKAPSLYKHYKGKEDILNAIIDAAEVRYEELFGSDRNIGKLPESKDEFIRSTMGKISFTMHDPMIRKIRKFLIQEQFRSERLADITTRHQLDGIQRMYTKIIEGMMNKGLFIKDDPKLLATELTAPVVLWIAQADRQPHCEKEIMESIEKHIRHFYDVYTNIQ